ncbi:MAG: hypothetical protein Q9160_003066 [Pyrenula sp. 1 TL-2023]
MDTIATAAATAATTAPPATPPTATTTTAATTAIEIQVSKKPKLGPACDNCRKIKKKCAHREVENGSDNSSAPDAEDDTSPSPSPASAPTPGCSQTAPTDSNSDGDGDKSTLGPPASRTRAQIQKEDEGHDDQNSSIPLDGWGASMRVAIHGAYQGNSDEKKQK